MSDILQNIFRLFSVSSINKTSIEEELTVAKLSISCNDLLIPSEENFNKITAMKSSRDSINISIFQNDITWNYVQNDNDNLSDFLQNCSTVQQSEEKEIIVSITKRNVEQTISVYYPGIFYKYLNELPFLGILLKINEVFNTHRYITFEIQDSSFDEFATKSIKFVAIGSRITNSNINRTERINKIKSICNCNVVSKYDFVPDDFYPITFSDNTTIKESFSRICTLYSAIFLFDIVDIDRDNNIAFKLNGYKTIHQTVPISNVNFDSYEIYYNIYSWVYEGGNIVDKIGLARNIISLNFDKDNLKLADTTFEAIKSGYKIYQKENIKQYIEIRNKISDQLIELQNKADKIVDSFVSDYKKTFLAVVSFFITVIVIRVVSKGDFIGGFTKEVTLLSIGFLLISLIVMFVARWEIKKQLIRYSEFYKNLKERYRDLLEESDIKRILNNDRDFNYNKQFIEKRRKAYTILWVVSLILLLIIVVVLYIFNLNFYEIIKSLICCIKNIL
jgi:hypothetical protein